MKNMFIVLEGGEGAGKTVLANNLVAYYDTNTDFNAIYLREPGGDEISEQIRNIVLNNDLDPYTQLLLFSAARKRNMHINVKPLLSKPDKTIIICDRFILSTIVYQGIVQGVPLQNIYYIMDMICGEIRPDIEIVLDVDPAIGLNRIKENNREINNLDAKGIEFHSKINNAYKAYTYGARYRTILDANQDPETIMSKACKFINAILKIEGMTNDK